MEANLGNQQGSNQKWVKFIILVLGAGTLFKLCSIKYAFYIPMQETLGLNHTQLGFLSTVYAITQTIGYFASPFIADRYSRKILISGSLIGVGLIGIYFATLPSYYSIVGIFAGLAIFGEVIYWPVLLKAIRLLGKKDEQGRVFGFLEAGRGVVDTVVAFVSLAIFDKMGGGAAGLKGAIIFYTVVSIVIGIISYFTIDDDELEVRDEHGNKINRNKVALAGAIKAAKMPEIWLVAFTIFSVYCVYCGLSSFLPFLKNIYNLPTTLVGAYGIISLYGLKMLGGPIGGFLADKKVKSSAKYIRGAFMAAIVAMSVIIFLPHETMNVYLGMCCTLGFGAIIFTMRAVYFAPMEEVNVPRKISGAAMGIGSLVGYAPSMFAYVLYGSLLDKNPGMKGYTLVFIVMLAFAVMGLIISSLLVRRINKNNALKVEKKAS